MQPVISSRTFDPSIEIVSPDLSVTGASLRPGGDLQAGEMATLEVAFILQRPVAQLAIALRLYDDRGRCAFASSLKESKSLAEGSHKVGFYFACTLSTGQYAASFEFAELLSPEFGIPQERADHSGVAFRYLGLHNWFVEFTVQNAVRASRHNSVGLVESEPDDEYSPSGYAQLPLEVVSSSWEAIGTGSQKLGSKQLPRFVLSEQGRLYSLAEILDALYATPVSVFSSPRPVVHPINQVLGPHAGLRVFRANEPPMNTVVGVHSEKGVRTNQLTGYLLYGPYLEITPGSYRVSFVGIAGKGRHILQADAVALRGNVLLANAPSCTVKKGHFQYQFNIEVDAPGHTDLEVRLWVDERADVLISHVEIEPLNVLKDQLLNTVMTAARLADWSGRFDNVLAVSQIFLALLGRAPNSEDMVWYKNMPAIKMIREVVSSHEYSLRSFNVSFINEVNLIYQDFLNRNPTEVELNNWISVNEISTSDAKKHIIRSIAYVHNKRMPFHIETSEKISFVFVFVNKKDRDSLEEISIVLKSLDDNIMVNFAAVEEAVENYSNFKTKNTIFVTATDYADRILRASGFEGRFVYMEHGVAPLKAYTYAEHYRRYDFALMPGDLWTERLERLYPELKGRLFAVGYPKLACKTVSKKDRKDYARIHGLDAAKPIVLFAPTWSGNDPERGINNIKHLTGLGNLIAIPHEGDLHLIPELQHKYSCIHVMADGETISDHYSYADLLVSDVSSTAIEFARLGKPVVCIKLANIPDYDHSFMHLDGVPGIPHTDYRWDFCHMVEAGDVVTTVTGILGSEKSAVLSEQASELVHKMCSSYGDESLKQAASVLLKIASTKEEKHD